MDREPQEMQRIYAEDILLNIKKGFPVKYDHVLVEGNLILGNLGLQKKITYRTAFNLQSGLSKEVYEVKAPIEINDSIIHGTLEFGSAIFEDAVDFHGSIFDGDVCFTESVFESEANFSNVQFNGNARFLWSRFEGYSPFEKSRFAKNAFFGGAKFEGDAIFDGTQFHGEANFSEAIFNGKAYFSEIEVAGNTSFTKSQFFLNSYFLKADFGNAYFKGVKFHEDADFTEAQFCGNAYFNRSQFNGNTYFLDSNFESNVCFLGANFGGHTHFLRNNFIGYLNLDLSRIYSMSLLDANFESGSTISLKQSDFFKLELKWPIISDKIIYDGPAYLALVRNYNNLGWFRDADNCYYRYRFIEGSNLKGISKFVDLIARGIYGYGVRPLNPFIIGFGVFVFSALIFLYENQAHSPLNALELSAIILTTTTQVGDLASLCRFWSICERILGFILMSVFLVVLGKKIIR